MWNSIADHVIQRCDSCQMVMAKYTLPSEIRNKKAKNWRSKIRQTDRHRAHLYRAYDSKCLSGENFWRLMALLKTSSPSLPLPHPDFDFDFDFGFRLRDGNGSGWMANTRTRSVLFNFPNCNRLAFVSLQIAKHFFDIFVFRLRVTRSAQSRLACVSALGRFQLGSESLIDLISSARWPLPERPKWHADRNTAEQMNPNYGTSIIAKSNIYRSKNKRCNPQQCNWYLWSNKSLTQTFLK